MCPFDGFDECRLLSTDKRASPMKNFYFKIDAGSEDVFAQKSQAGGFPDSDRRMLDGQRGYYVRT